MKALFYNFNNNDTDHDIIFLSLTVYASGTEKINVLFDGSEYCAPVMFDYKGHRYFKHAGKEYHFIIKK